MSATLVQTRNRINELLTNLNPNFPGIGINRLNPLIESQMQTMPGIQFGDAWVTGAVSLTVAAGSDYTLSSLLAANVQMLRLTYDGSLLNKRNPLQMEGLRIGNVVQRGVPTDYAVWEDDAQALKLRVFPAPDANYTLDRFGQVVPANLSTDASVIPFTDPMLRALEKLVCATCIDALNDQQLENLGINRDLSQTFRGEAKVGIYWERVRRNRLDRQGHPVGYA
jgi:hypothetical protein